MSRLTKKKTCLVEHKKHRRKQIAQAIMAVAALMSGTKTYASMVRFDNPSGPGHFNWSTVAGSNILNIMADSANQPSVTTDGGFQLQSVSAGITVGGFAGQPGNINGGVQRVLDVPGGINYAASVATGDAIPVPGNTNWGTGGVYITTAGHPASMLTEGLPSYLAVRFDPVGGTRYGWIGVVRTGNTFDAFAWGYETEHDVPAIAGTPEPGSLALLAFGATAVAARRRRKAVN